LGLPYYRFFPADYLRDTRRLTLLQHGAYRILIDEYMGAGGLRGDLDGMCRVCGALSGEERAAVEFVLSEFFTKAGPTWKHKRCDEELEHLSSKTFAARDSALARWKKDNANAKRTQSGRNANPESESESESDLELDSKSRKSKTSSGSQANTDAAGLLHFLNSKANRFYRPTPKTLEPILARLKEGNTVSDCKAVIARKCREWKDDEKMRKFLRPVTLFNATKFAQYIGEVPTEEPNAN